MTSGITGRRTKLPYATERMAHNFLPISSRQELISQYEPKMEWGEDRMDYRSGIGIG